jgi:hypothetical protein
VDATFVDIVFDIENRSKPPCGHEFLLAAASCLLPLNTCVTLPHLSSRVEVEVARGTFHEVIHSLCPPHEPRRPWKMRSGFHQLWLFPGRKMVEVGSPEACCTDAPVCLTLRLFLSRPDKLSEMNQEGSHLRRNQSGILRFACEKQGGILCNDAGKRKNREPSELHLTIQTKQAKIRIEHGAASYFRSFCA